MIVKRKWKGKRKWSHGAVKDTWPREGWLLFNLIPLYVRDLQEREDF